MRYLGIDFGTKRVGIALSDEAGMIAEPLTTLANDDNLVKRITELCDEHQVAVIVIGASYNFQGADNPVMTQIREITPILERKTGCEVVMESEVLTTAQAARVSENRDRLDSSAAALILQSYLDRTQRG